MSIISLGRGVNGGFAAWRTSRYCTAAGNNACVQASAAIRHPDGRFSLTAAGADRSDTATRLNERLKKVLPPFEGNSVDCVIRMESVRADFYKSPRVMRDDSALGTGRHQDALASAVGGVWQPVGSSLEIVIRRLEELGHGAAAFVLTSPPGDQNRHGFVLRNEDGTVFRIETQETEGGRVSPAIVQGWTNPVTGQPMAPSIGTRVIVVDSSGRAVPLAEDLVSVARTVDAVVDPSRDLKYKAMGVELEVGFIVHGRNGVPLDHETILMEDDNLGIKLITDSWEVVVAGGRYFPSQEAALAARVGRVTRQTVMIVEIVNKPPVGVILPEETNLPSLEQGYRSIREVLRILRTARPHGGDAGPGRPGTSLLDLFPPAPGRRFFRESAQLSIVPGPWGTQWGTPQISVGLPGESIPAFQRFAARHNGGFPFMQRYLASSLGFAASVTRDFIQFRIKSDTSVDRYAVVALDYTPAVSLFASAMELLASHAYAEVHTYLINPGGRAKNNVHATLRTSFSGVLQALPVAAREYIYKNARPIKTRLREYIEYDFAQDIRRHKEQRIRQNLPALDIFKYPLQYQDELTLDDYVNNMLQPRHRRRVHVDQADAMNVRTNFDSADTNDGRLTHPLIVVEWRNLGKRWFSIDEAEEKYRAVADFAQLAYANREKLALNEQNPKGQKFTEALNAAVGHLSGLPRDGGPVSQVRELLEEVVDGQAESLRTPITRDEVTSNIIADTVLALHSFSRSGDWQARPLRAALEALRMQVSLTIGPRNRSRSGAVGLMHRVNGIIDDLRRREMDHLLVVFADRQRRLLPGQRADLHRFAAHVADQARRGSRLRVRVESPDGDVASHGLFRRLFRIGRSVPAGEIVAGAVRLLIYGELSMRGMDPAVVAVQTRARSLDTSAPRHGAGRPVWVSVAPVSVPEPVPVSAYRHGGRSQQAGPGRSGVYRSASAGDGIRTYGIRRGVPMGRVSFQPVPFRPTPMRGGRSLPVPPSTAGDGDRSWVVARLRLPRNTDVVTPRRGDGPWAGINRPVPGVTTQPSINQSVSALEEGAVAAKLARFVAERYPVLHALNPTGNTMNCNQAVVAVDYMLNGDAQVRVPPSGTGGWYGLDLLQDRYGGHWVQVDGYDDIITRIADEPGSRGVVFIGARQGDPHLFNVTHTDVGVVFLDGQIGGLAALPANAVEVGLMMYHPSGKAEGTADLEPKALQWTKSTHSMADNNGEKYCVEVTSIGGTGKRSRTRFGGPTPSRGTSSPNS
ncbi:toxin glutamine deamidase domain-containing protein [Actinoallomurus purpureus]|uniref:toxin glutamine deamidase domain-containing protein n=1 Tax=Actinoallomurus purpureus TaxID=478114 RepID=UPI002093F1E2|nr:toxin glutamine deamidase domain-containing protein [Actinoallomurus purpureus]MCO6005357.1 toxin glutamine deamidase domain-containing protein [Actinoallomurus purpureus]